MADNGPVESALERENGVPAAAGQGVAPIEPGNPGDGDTSKAVHQLLLSVLLCTTCVPYAFILWRLVTIT